MRVAILASTGGAVFGTALGSNPAFRSAVHLVLTDRPCAAESVAEEHGILQRRLEAPSNAAFSAAALAELTLNHIDVAFLFLQRLLVGELLESYRDRLVNFHPSLLPAARGLHGFEESIEGGALVIGSTVHFVTGDLDAGPQILQAFCAVPRGARVADLRHTIFLQQCASLIQVWEWIRDGRVRVAGTRAEVANATYAVGPYVPALDSKAARELAVVNH